MRCSHLLVVHLLLTVIEQHQPITIAQEAIAAKGLRSNQVTEFLCSDARLQLVTGYWEDSGHMKTTQGMRIKKFQHPQSNSLLLQHHTRDFL
jgi:hypothetical protein